MFRSLREDLDAVLHHDPAAGGRLEVLLCHTALHAIVLYRAAHFLRVRLGVRIVPRMLSILARFWSGVEIHPDAKIGRRFFIDHGTGVVIGATAEVGDDCIFFHNVTLGGTGHHHGKRHPTLGHNVFVGTGAILLGPIRVGDNAKIGANAFVRMHDVPADCTVVGVPARIVRRKGEPVDEPLPPTQVPIEAVAVPISTDRATDKATGGSR